MKNKENELSPAFFEGMLNDVGKALERLDNLDGVDLKTLGYQEGKAFIAYQIYRQRIHNPKLLEIATRRLKKCKEIYQKWEVSVEDCNEDVDNEDVLTLEKIDKMKKPELIAMLSQLKIDGVEEKVEPMKEALRQIVNK